MISAVGQYNVLERLGEGALGDVFRARDTRTGRTVALMVPPPELIASPARRGRFLEDARKAARLESSEYRDALRRRRTGRSLLPRLRIRRRTVAQRGNGDGAVDVSHALHIAAHIADALAGGHANGIVHGDVRPDTIVVTPKGSVKVLNFGMTMWTEGAVARARAATAPRSLDSEETLVTGYLSPEQARGATVDPRSDLFALGVVLYQMLTGRQPFAAATADVTITNVLRQTPSRPSAVNPDLPAELDGIVMKLLAKEPDARYQTAAAIATDIRLVAAELDRRMN